MRLLTPPARVGRAAEAEALLLQRDRYARQRQAPGFRQEAMHDATYIRWDGPGDPVAEQVALQAAAMGVEAQLVLSGGARLPAGTGRRAMLLNDDARIWPATPALARAVLKSEPSRKGFAVLDLRNEDRAREFPLDVPTFFHARTDERIVFGSDPDAVRDRAGGRPGSYERPHPGAEVILVASFALADLLASVGAYISPLDDDPMPRAPAVDEIPVLAGTPRIEGLVLTIVGAGGALGHAVLEAILADPVLCAALDGGEIRLVDPDVYELSNLSRQTFAGGAHNLMREKAVVTAEEVRGRLPGETRVVAVPQRFAPEMVAGDQAPGAILLLTDNFPSRAEGWNAVRHNPGTFVGFAASETTQSCARAVIVGRGACLDCGPEELARMAERARARDDARAAASCSAESTPSHIASNALASAHLALELKRAVLFDEVDPRQRLFSWELPNRTVPSLENAQPCGCWGTGS